MSDDVTWLDYDKLAQVFGIERESARRLVMRKRWARSKGNDGKARVGVPNDALPRVPVRSTGERPVNETGDSTGELADGQGSDSAAETGTLITGDVAGERPAHDMPKAAQEPVTAVLTRHIDRLEVELVELRTRAADRDLIASQVEALRAVLDEVRQDRDRWHEAATRMPELASHRPWWRRLVG